MTDVETAGRYDPRDPERFRRFHERVRTHEPDWIYLLAQVLLTPTVYGPLGLRTIGSDNVPPTGGAILAPNHFSGWDHFLVAARLFRRPVQFMAKSQLYANPVLEWILSHGGAFPVRRGARDEEATTTALAILERGGLVLLYPEGGRSRTGTLREPRPGVGRLALQSGMPVVPVAIHGSDRVAHWREDLRRGRRPMVTVQYGEPLRFDRVADPDRDAQQRAADEIFACVRRLYEGLDEALRAQPRRAILRRGARA